MRILVNIDVPDLEAAIDFYGRAFGLTLHRRLGPGAAEMLGASAPIYLLQKAAGTPAAGAVRQPRDYARHWTPVHLDVVVDDVDDAVARAVAAGARLEDPAASHDWGRIAHLSDPFGHGICIMQFLGRGYDALAAGALRDAPVTEADFDTLLAIRIEAMRDSLERLGRFDPERARARLRATFRPDHTWFIERDGARIGFYAVRPDGDGLRLDHLYVVPAAQGLGVGGQVLGRLLQDADRRGLPVSVGALRGSDSNRFYRRHGFAQVSESEWDIEYLRLAPGRA
ncbi:GNAT family acetyltransferase [Achromobacter xylosoxidans]|uniref:VOC family protein n=1 Tax=Achromobacter sp. HNDS-1 TaxID=3151598 RepID=A0AAU7LGR9_9BURK|nr:VOC family protein [Achromobacter ruhlandii]ALX86138.1 GNAT family acetyltransferase [Achromobacter denitrificans]AMG44903.1 GNAT family N-acetyltransferase [Achromobacter xylosoxidans]OCZ66791.1 GNAT family acetyltransferase [Achromobacter xylosoxidans]OCZ67951.1 GNAT family acetyltransferase [Achromobacter xylosoxidans]CUI29068.1 Predicted enzyme related to lactoylglutathione lyase [Achromobacter ruhlandii]